MDSGYIPLIREASSCIKSSGPEQEDEQLVRGYVVRIASEDPAESGEITIKDLMTERPRHLLVELSGDDYQKAIAAHNNKQVVELSGTVIRAGRTLRLLSDSPSATVDIA